MSASIETVKRLARRLQVGGKLSEKDTETFCQALNAPELASLREALMTGKPLAATTTEIQLKPIKVLGSDLEDGRNELLMADAQVSDREVAFRNNRARTSRAVKKIEAMADRWFK